jgi:hypothetical protein
MTKQRLLKPVNGIMAFIFLCLACTALLDDVIPRDKYEVVHPLLGYTFLACVASHVFLNWSWVKSAMLKKAKPKA